MSLYGDDPLPCQLCGGASATICEGRHGSIAICSTCATTRLIPTIVDSLPRYSLDVAVSVWEQLTALWYRSIVARAERENPTDPETGEVAW